MKVNDTTRLVLAARRESRELEAAGYRRHETDWEIVRGARTSEIILDARVSADGKSVWTKIGAAP